MGPLRCSPAFWGSPGGDSISFEVNMRPMFKLVRLRRVCSAHEILSKDPCWVFSLGSNGQTDFEEAVRSRYPHCNIHIYDPTLKRSKANKVAAKTGVRAVACARSSSTTHCLCCLRPIWTRTNTLRASTTLG